MKVQVTLIGCDDSTEFELDIERNELYLLREIATKSKEISTYGCMPIFKIETLINTEGVVV